MMGMQYARNWSFVERFYLPVYAKSRIHGVFPKAHTRYSLIDGVNRKGQQRLALAGEVEAATNAKGQPVYVLTEEGRRHDLVRLAWDEGPVQRPTPAASISRTGSIRIRRYGITSSARLWALAIFVLLLFVTVPRDRERALIRKHGRRLRGTGAGDNRRFQLAA